MEDTVNMEVKELYGVTLSAIRTPYAISWSEDNKISLITTSALHIVEVCPCPSFTSPGFNIKRTLIKPDSDLPTVKSGIDTDDIIWKLNQYDVFRMILDTSLAPNLSGTKPLDVHVLQAQWSPAGMLQENRCMLACLTNHGSLKLYCPRYRSWTVVADIAELWVTHCSKGWDIQPIDPREAFNVLEERVKQIQTTALTWSELQTTSSRCSFLVTGHSNGHVTVWRVSAAEKACKEETVVGLVLKQETGLRRITALHWLHWDQQFVLLVAGDVEGCVKFLLLCISEETVSCVGLEDAWSDADRMRVLKVASLPPAFDDSVRTVAVVKDSYVVVFLVQRDKVLASQPHLVGNLTVSGLEALDSETFLACTHSGCMTKLHIVRNGLEGLSVNAEELPCDISFKRMACYGIACTRNRGLWVMATSICKLYDHLVVRKPAQALFFYLQGNADPFTVLVNNSSKSLTHHWQFLELIRFHCVKKRSPPELPFLQHPDKLDNLSTYQLKVELWLTRIAFALLPSSCGAQKQQELVSYVSQLEYLVFCRHTCSRIRALTTAAESLAEPELASLGLLRAWLQAWLSSAPDISPGSNATVALAQSTLALPTVPSVPDRELCTLCQREVLLTPNWRHALCPENHRMARCCRTLLNCREVPYRICQVCPTMAKQRLGPDEEVVCVFCDSPLIIDDKVKIPIDAAKHQEPNVKEETKGSETEETGDKSIKHEVEMAAETGDKAMEHEVEMAEETGDKAMEHEVEMKEVQESTVIYTDVKTKKT